MNKPFSSEPPTNPLSPQEEPESVPRDIAHTLWYRGSRLHHELKDSLDLHPEIWHADALKQMLGQWDEIATRYASEVILAAPKVVDSKEEQFGIGPGTVKQCGFLDGERYCCRLRDGHEGEHAPWTADDVAKLRKPEVEGIFTEQSVLDYLHGIESLACSEYAQTGDNKYLSEALEARISINSWQGKKLGNISAPKIEEQDGEQEPTNITTEDCEKAHWCGTGPYSGLP